jgi:hypothetical protein
MATDPPEASSTRVGWRWRAITTLVNVKRITVDRLLRPALPHARQCAGVRRAKGKPERAPAWPVHGGSDRRAQAD